MASFTDDPRLLSNFSPYVQTLPVEDMARIGIIKEEQFRQGVQQVQGWVDELSGLPIAKQEVKNYVQTRLGQLKEGVTKNLAGDFSDMRITNQIGGAAKTIARDPIVNNAVQSTNRMQTALSEAAEAKKAGKSSVQNEAFLNEAVSGWINDGQLDTQFTGSYTPYVDITDRFLKIYKEQNPGENISQDAFRTDENGNTVINPVLFKGKGPEKIQALFNIVASQPDVQNQLRIDGWWKYRGVDVNQLGRALQTGANTTLKSIEDSIRTLQTKVATGSNDPNLSTQIEQLKQQALARKKGYDNISRLLATNPEAAKAELAKEELNSNLINAFTYQVMEKSPLWETSMQQKTFDREVYEWQKTYEFNERKFQWDMYKDTETLRIAREKKAKEESGSDVITESPIQTADLNVGSSRAYEDAQAAGGEYNQAMLELVSAVSGGNIVDSPAVLDPVSGGYKLNFGSGKRYKTKEEAMDAVSVLLSTTKDEYMNGKIADERIAGFVEKTNQKWNNYQAKNKIITDVEGQFGEQLFKAGVTAENKPYFDVVLVEKKLPGWERVKSQLISKYGEDYESALGIRSVKKYDRFGGAEYQSGKNFGKYKEAQGFLDASKAAIIQAREEEYLRRQTTGIPLTVTHDVSKSEFRESVNTRFNALAKARALNAETGKGDAANILELTGRAANKRGELQYRSGVDQTGRPFIEVSDGTSTEIMEVTPSEYYRQFPERRVNNEFREKFGALFDLTQQTSTDPLGETGGGGRANAFLVKSAASPYTVQYHVIKQGPNQYSIKWWVTPKANSATPIINGENASGTVPGMPTSLTEEEVMQWTTKFQDKNWVDQVVALKALQRQ